MPLIVRKTGKNTDQGSSPREDLEPLVEPAFLLPRQTKLLVGVKGWERRAESYYARHVARFPTDVRTHVRRVAHHGHRGEPDATYAALVDLFVALGECGHDLKRRFLDLFGGLLGKQQQEVLQRALATGMSALNAVPPAPDACLHAGVSGITGFVTEIDTAQDKASERDPLEDAADYMEHGQLDQAQSVLEAAMKKYPERGEIQSDLLTIYRHTGDRDRFRTTRAAMQELGTPLSEAWEKLHIYFEGNPS